MVRSPLTWVLTYAGYAPSRLPDLLKATSCAPGDELQQLVLSYLLMHVVTTNSPGLMQVFDALHFPDHDDHDCRSSARCRSRGSASAISTSGRRTRSSSQSAELTGMDAFEEVVNVEDLSHLRDPLKERLLEIARQQAPELVPR